MAHSRTGSAQQLLYASEHPQKTGPKRKILNLSSSTKPGHDSCHTGAHNAMSPECPWLGRLHEHRKLDREATCTAKKAKR